MAVLDDGLGLGVLVNPLLYFDQPPLVKLVVFLKERLYCG